MATVGIPDTGARNQLMRLSIGENVVQRPDATGELAARGIWIIFLDDLAKPGGLPSADRILHGISIEITKHKNRVISEGLVDPTRQCLSLGDAACAGCPATIMAVLHDTAARPIRTRLDIVVMAIPS